MNAKDLLNEGVVQALVENAIDSAWIIDDRQKILYVNHTAQILTGYDRRELVGSSLGIILPMELKARHLTFMLDYMTGDQGAKVLGQVREFKILHKSGELIDIALKAIELPCKSEGRRLFGAFMADIREQVILRQELEEQALLDPLTGLMNRRSFARMVTEEIAYAERHSQCLSFLVFDIDRFKAINDTYGHGAGDDVLKGLASRILDALRTGDKYSRLGGDEFAILLRETDMGQAGQVAERLRERVAQSEFVTRRGPVPVTISAGYTIWRATDRDFVQMFDRADQALYKAKQEGRNQVCDAA